ncbi:MAG: hypothetical protein QG638_2223, partial [Pseudomonadota bacterium]|nr:hypothetical protein [Pseudomonadota bacterium]
MSSPVNLRSRFDERE